VYHSCTKTLPAAIDDYSGDLRSDKKDWYRKIREQNEIDKQNLKIHVALEEHKRSRKKYRKEIQKSIENYLNLRDRITKLKTSNYEKVVLSCVE